VTEPDNAGLNPGGRHAATPTIGQLVAEASAHVSTIVRGEIDLAKHELKSSVKNAGTGAGLFIGAAALLLFSLTFLFIGVAETLTRYVMPRFAAYFATFGFFFLIALLLVWIGVRKVKRVKAPTRTIETGKDTVAYLKANTNIR
jgi:hypothetical protein